MIFKIINRTTQTQTT